MNPQPKVQERFSTLPKLWGNGSQGNKSWPKAKVVYVGTYHKTRKDGNNYFN